METERDIQHYRDVVTHPGKFEGEAPYIPYYYDLYLEGCADESEGYMLHFDVIALDVERFPELKGHKDIYFIEQDDGFVKEVQV